MTKMWVLGLALILLLVPFALISIGTTRGVPTLWWVGLALLVVGGLIPPATRFLFPEDQQEDDDDGDDDGGHQDSESYASEAPPLEQVRVEPIASQRAPRRSGLEDADAASHAHRAEAHEERAAALRAEAEAREQEARAHEEEARAEEARARAEAERARRTDRTIPPASPRDTGDQPSGEE
jgi:hypothetical protein